MKRPKIHRPGKTVKKNPRKDVVLWSNPALDRVFSAAFNRGINMSKEKIGAEIKRHETAVKRLQGAKTKELIRKRNEHVLAINALNAALEWQKTHGPGVSRVESQKTRKSGVKTVKRRRKRQGKRMGFEIKGGGD